MGSNVLWMTEWLCERLDLRPGMRVLDLGCGRAKSSIFLGPRVWRRGVGDRFVDRRRPRIGSAIRDAGLEDRVFPLHCRCPGAAVRGRVLRCDRGRRLLFVFRHRRSVPELSRAVREAGRADRHRRRGLVEEMPSPVPEHLREFWTQDFWCLHSVAWWRRHWERTGLVEIRHADTMEDGWKLWSHWQRAQLGRTTRPRLQTSKRMRAAYLTYIRLVGRRREGMKLEEYCLAGHAAVDAAAVREEADAARRSDRVADGNVKRLAFDVGSAACCCRRARRIER